MIIRGHRFDLLNRRQVIDLEIEKPEVIPQNTLRLLAIPLGNTEKVIPNWMPHDSIPGLTLTARQNAFRMIIDTASISLSIDTLVFIIHAEKTGMMRFNMQGVGNIFIRINNDLFDLKEYSNGRAIVAFSIYRRDTLWRFRAIGEPYQEGLEDIYQNYGIDPALAPHKRK